MSLDMCIEMVLPGSLELADEVAAHCSSQGWLSFADSRKTLATALSSGTSFLSHTKKLLLTTVQKFRVGKIFNVYERR